MSHGSGDRDRIDIIRPGKLFQGGLGGEALGSTVTGRVVAGNDRNRQIGLTQLDPHPALDSDSGR